MAKLEQQAPRMGLLSRIWVALRSKWRLHEANREANFRLRLAREENDYLREQLARYRDTSQSLAMQHLADGARAKTIIEGLSESSG